jgi:hypothetical protein
VQIWAEKIPQVGNGGAELPSASASSWQRRALRRAPRSARLAAPGARRTASPVPIFNVCSFHVHLVEV